MPHVLTAARTMARNRIDPTPDQLQAAWLARRRPNWPATLEDTLAVPLYAGLVRMHAVMTVLHQRRKAQQAADQQASKPAGLTARAVPPNWLRRSGQPAGIDRKRAAAGDQDD